MNDKKVVTLVNKTDKLVTYQIIYKDKSVSLIKVHHLGWDAVNTHWILGFIDDAEDSQPVLFINTEEILSITQVEEMNG